MKYPVYHAHKSTKQLIAKQVARFLAKPVALTFVGMVLAALAANHQMAQQQAESDAITLAAMMDSQKVALLPPPVVGH
jgi:hypothetical protein